MNRILMGALLPAVVLCAPAASARTTASCATTSAWLGATRGDVVAYAPAPSSAPTRSWTASWVGRGLAGVHGRRRARLARAGGVWAASPSDVGLDPASALAAFRRIGVRARLAHGMVEFRARSGAATASRALAAAGASRPVATPVDVGGSGVDVAMLRLEGLYSSDATAFVEGLPAGIEVVRFGTGYEARVPSSMVGPMWDAIDREGSRTLLVGASGRVATGRAIGSVVEACGGVELAHRLPTPVVLSASPSGVLVGVDGRRLSFATGDASLTVQDPVDGRGVVVAVSRLSGR